MYAAASLVNAENPLKRSLMLENDKRWVQWLAFAHDSCRELSFEKVRAKRCDNPLATG